MLIFTSFLILTIFESMPATIGSVAGIFVALIYAYHRVAKTVATIRDNARLAERERNDEKQREIRDAVEAERQRWKDHKENESERIKRLQEIAGEWRDIATQKDQRNQLLMEELNTLHIELKELKEKYESVLELYTESQRRLSDLETLVRNQ